MKRGCSQSQSQKFDSFIKTGVGGINSLSDLHLEVECVNTGCIG